MSQEAYSGVRLFNALYVHVSTTLFNFYLLILIRFETENKPSSLNICSDGVLNSQSKIIRVARFCNFDKRSMCIPAADSHSD